MSGASQTAALAIPLYAAGSCYLEKGWSGVRPFCPAPFRSYLDPVKAKEARRPFLQSHWGAVGLNC